MSNSPSSPAAITEDDKGVRVPSWVLGIVCTVITAGVVGGTAIIVDTRTDLARLDERISQLTTQQQADKASLSSVPTQLATLSTQVTALQAEVARLAAKLDERRPPR